MNPRTVDHEDGEAHLAAPPLPSLLGLDASQRQNDERDDEEDAGVHLRPPYCEKDASKGDQGESDERDHAAILGLRSREAR